MNLANKELTVIKALDNFLLAYDPSADTFDFDKPNYYIISKNYNKIEAATPNIIAGLSSLEMFEEGYKKVLAGIVEDTIEPPRYN